MNSIVMHAAVITSYFTGPTIIKEEEEELEEKTQESKVAIDQDKLVDENSMECFLEFLIEFFN